MNPLPKYSLQLIQALVASGAYRATGTAVNGAGAIGLRERDICRCIGALTAREFYKTMEAKERPGFWQDVYRPRYRGKNIYLKVQLEGTAHDRLVVVIQFKESTSLRGH